MGGHFGAVHFARACRILEADFPDYSIEELVVGGKVKFVVRDSYRPDFAFVGKTPKEALQKAGVHVTGYYSFSDHWEK